MKPLPRSGQALVLRTDFSDQPAWEAIRSAITAPARVPGTSFEFFAYVSFVDDADYRDLDIGQVQNCSAPIPTRAS